MPMAGVTCISVTEWGGGGLVPMAGVNVTSLKAINVERYIQV